MLVPLALPQELLDGVLRAYFKDIVVTVNPPVAPDEMISRKPRKGMHSGLGLLLVSKNMYRRAMPAFFEHATFVHEGLTISHDLNFWKHYRSGFPSKRFRKVAGDIEFMLLVNKGWGLLGSPYARVKDITVKDAIFACIDDDILEQATKLQAKCQRDGAKMKCYFVVAHGTLSWEYVVENLETVGEGIRVAVNENGVLTLREINAMEETNFDQTKAWLEIAFGGVLEKPDLVLWKWDTCRYLAQASEWWEPHRSLEET